MQAPTDNSTSSSTDSARPLPLANDLPSSDTPQKIDSALGHVSPGCTHYAAEGDKGAEVLLEAEPNDDVFSGIADFVWDDGHRACETPQEILDFEALDEFSLDTSYLEAPPIPSLLGEWTAEWQFDIGKADPATCGDLSQTSPLYYYSSSLEPTENENENPIWYCESPYSTYTAEPISPSSLPSIASLSAVERGRRGSSSSRGSRPTSRSQIRPSTSEPYKRRIDPLRHAKTSSKDSGDLSQCDTCEHTFRYKKDLERHKSSVHVRRPSWFCPVHECKFATRGFSRKDKAFQHVRTHRRDSDTGLEPIFDADQGPTEPPASGKRAVDQSSAPPIPVGNPPSNRTSLIIDATSSQSQRAGQATKPHICSVSGCDTAFVNYHDLRRHLRTLHIHREAGGGYRCASMGCKRADKIWPRLDSFRQHVLRRHAGEDVDVLVRRSTRSLHEARDSFPITIATPQTFGRIHRTGGSVEDQDHIKVEQSRLGQAESLLGKDQEPCIIEATSNRLERNVDRRTM